MTESPILKCKSCDRNIVMPHPESCMECNPVLKDMIYDVQKLMGRKKKSKWAERKQAAYYLVMFVATLSFIYLKFGNSYVITFNMGIICLVIFHKLSKVFSRIF